VVDFLKNQPKVALENHPALPDNPYHTLYLKYFPRGAGSIFTIELAGSEREAKSFSERLKLFSLLANVADVKSLVIHPASTTHSQMSTEELGSHWQQAEYRFGLSIGTEHIDDILEDLAQALG
jgi:O-acetylhomoserine (thiol)-lyase